MKTRACPASPIYLDKNGNGVLDKGEKSQVLTDSKRQLHLPVPDGWNVFRSCRPSDRLLPHRRPKADASHSVVLSNGINGTGKNFRPRSTTALLSGTVFSDKNSNDKLDSGEAGISGFTVWIDANNNGKLDSGEKAAGTDSNGYWVFKSIKAGTYNVKIQAETGYKTIGIVKHQHQAGPGWFIHRPALC